MRRWVASVLLFGLVVLTVTPARLPSWIGALRLASSLSEPSTRGSELRVLPSAAQHGVAPSAARAELGTPSVAALVAPSALRFPAGQATAAELESWLRDQRESIRRVCRRKVPPEPLSSSPV